MKIQIQRHKDKIGNERSKRVPDEGKIHHWEAEIKAFNVSLERALRRLEK